MTLQGQEGILIPTVAITGVVPVSEEDHINSLLSPFTTAAHTATPVAAQETWLYGPSARLSINFTVTPNNSEWISVAVYQVDQTSTQSELLGNLPPITSSTLGATPAAGTAIFSWELNALPRVFAVQPQHSGSGSWTYSVGLCPTLATRTAPVARLGAQSLISASATGAGLVLDNWYPASHHSLIVTSGAGVSAGVVTLQGSMDKTNWFSTSATVTTNAANSTFAANLSGFPFRYLRANITTTITGGTVSAIVASS